MPRRDGQAGGAVEQRRAENTAKPRPHSLDAVNVRSSLDRGANAPRLQAGLERQGFGLDADDASARLPQIAGKAAPSEAVAGGAAREVEPVRVLEFGAGEGAEIG